MEDPTIVAAGAAVLRIVGSRLRHEAALRGDAPEIWLAIRDIEGRTSKMSPCSMNSWLVN